MQQNYFKAIDVPLEDLGKALHVGCSAKGWICVKGGC